MEKTKIRVFEYKGVVFKFNLLYLILFMFIPPNAIFYLLITLLIRVSIEFFSLKKYGIQIDEMELFGVNNRLDSIDYKISFRIFLKTSLFFTIVASFFIFLSTTTTDTLFLDEFVLIIGMNIFFLIYYSLPTGFNNFSRVIELFLRDKMPRYSTLIYYTLIFSVIIPLLVLFIFSEIWLFAIAFTFFASANIMKVAFYKLYK